MSDENPTEHDLGRPLRRPEIERQLGRPLRPSLPPPPDDLDDEPLTRDSDTRMRTPEHWPDEERVASPSMDFTIEEGDIIEAMDWYFPLFWAACVIIVSYVGIYHAVGKITTHNPLPPSLSF